jgi:hypothetical protein
MSKSPVRVCDRQTVPADVPLGLGWLLSVEPRSAGVILRLKHPREEPMAIQIQMSAHGPIVRTYAAALELETADEIVARCETFAIEARKEVRLSAATIVHRATETLHCEGGDVEIAATSRDVRVRANDDVKLRGERVLLNCDREPPMPSWVPQTSPAEVALPRQDAAADVGLSGDAEKRR